MTEFKDFFNDDPWENLKTSSYPDGQRLYLKDNRFWVALNEEEELVFFVEEEGLHEVKKPKELSGLDILITPFENNKTRLVCTLKEQGLKDKFSIVAKDVAYSVSEYKGSDLIIQSKERILSWANFLKPSRKGLTFSEWIGLWGELYTLVNILGNALTMENAVKFWIGPENKKQDFTMNKIAIETKTTLSGDGSVIKISSLEQLEKITQELYLMHIFCNYTTNEEAFSLEKLHKKCLELTNNDQATQLKFLNKVNKLYGKASQEQLETGLEFMSYDLFLVDEEFPKLVPETVPNSVSKAKYEITSRGLAKYRVEKKLEDIVKHE